MQEVDVGGDGRHVRVREVDFDGVFRCIGHAARLRSCVHHSQLFYRLLASLLVHVVVEHALVHEEGALQMTLFVLLEGTDVDQDSL